MRQKYSIYRNVGQKILRIREYAIVEKDLKKIPSEELRKDHFSFLCEETYKSEHIDSAISRGIGALIQTLRTRNIFPISPYAGKIAESVIELYRNSEDCSVELFFNDMDLNPDPVG
jgi:hypothetical protein